MSQRSLQSLQTKNLDSYHCNQIESLSSEYGPQHPPPPNYRNENPQRNIQILAHNKPKQQNTAAPIRSITPPPHTTNGARPSLKPSKSASYSYLPTKHHSSPPLTANIAVIEQTLKSSTNKNKSDSICSIESLDEKEHSISIESVEEMDGEHKEETKKAKIRMWNTLAYGLEDIIEGNTFEWIDSKYVGLLQLSTYSTVMGPKVKFVWKNSQIYNMNCNHELEAWIAKQTLDCTEWKNRHNKTTPPPFTKKTMIVPEFGVVLNCIQFDSSLRALRNKEFNQYINGIYSSIKSKTSNDTPSSYSTKSYSSRYSTKSSPIIGDTLADYLSKCAPFSFCAGMAGGMNVSGANVPQVPFNYAMYNQDEDSFNTIQPNIDDNEDPDDIGHYSLVLAVEYKYYESFIECLDGIEHWLYMIASQIRYLLALNKCFKCDHIKDDIQTIIPFMTNIVPIAIFKFDQLFSAKNLALPISLFDSWFTSSLDNRDKHKLSTMISSHLQTLARTVIVGDDEQQINRYIKTLALFSTSQQKSLSRLSVKVDDDYSLCTHYIPELYLQGIVVECDDIITYLQSSKAIKELQKELYLAPGPCTLILLSSSFWWINQTARPHKFKQEQQSLLFQKLFYLKRRTQSISSIPQPIHAPHSHCTDHNTLSFVEPSLSPMIATIVFGSFNIPQQFKMTFLETQFRILLQKASEILLYIEHEQRDLLSFYDKTCHVMSCNDFKEQVPMEALYPQIMQKFESQLRSDLQISYQEDLFLLLSISEGFRPNLFSLMFGNPVFDIEVADILRYFLF